jgi:integrase/recombinase XerD
MRLEEGIRIYVEQRQSTGIYFSKGCKTYEAFLRSAGNLPISRIQVQHVSQFLDQPQISSLAFRRTHSLLRHFFEYWSAHGAIAEVPLPPNLPRRLSTFIPYIYSREELRSMVQLAPRLTTSNDTVDWRTFRAVLVALYATGATVGEVTKLAGENVNLRDETISFSSSHLKLERCIPLCKDLVRVLKQHVAWRERKGIRSRFFFATVAGGEIAPRKLLAYFQRLRRAAGIVGYRGSKQRPCLRDLRATFAVHQVTSWIKRNEDLNRMLPALGAYMGNVGLESAERYLQLTPERFQKALNKLSPSESGARWRNDPVLFDFLSKL